MQYKGSKTQSISFPLGGIGTGCIGLMGNGELSDWEIFNRPNKNTRNGYSHFSIKATQNGKSVAKVLHGDVTTNLMGTPCASKLHSGFGFGPHINTLAGFPHFKDVTFDGAFPVANLLFEDPSFPAIVRLCAFNPFIPHDDFNSSLPAAFFAWEVENLTKEPLLISLACTVQNPAICSKNEKVSGEGATGLLFTNAGASASDVEYSDLCILTDGADCDVQEYWYRGPWRDAPTMYWNNFSGLDRMPQRRYEAPAKTNDHGTVASYATIPAGQKETLRFIIAWNVPNVSNHWSPENPDGSAKATWRNYYATQFENSFATARYALSHFDDFCEKTVLFANSIQRSTLSEATKDAISANLSVLKSPTVLRLEDGTFWGWEGCSETIGSCFGSCQHVWNYAYAMPYLFPALERSMREATMKYALCDNGATGFRIDLPPKRSMDTACSCVDGQMGEVIKCFREWKLSGNDEWLKSHAESIFKMLEFAWAKDNPHLWDADQDGIMEGRQHHTLDLELFGPNSWLQGFYLLALDCGAQMAEYLGQNDRASLYRSLYENGKRFLNTELFNGRYYHQKVDLSNYAIPERFRAVDGYWNEEAKEIKYQIADGCIIDQMLADFHAVLIGAKGVFDPEKKKIALENLYKNNFKSSMRDIANMWRNFTVNDESGVIICSYPDGAYKPSIPISYCEETMTGFEYAFAALLIAEGFLQEGETVVRAIRERYDGEKRNPWNEIECGSNYARSMASFALLPIYSGFSFDMTRKHIGFAPLVKKGAYMFSVADTWGMVSFDDKRYEIEIFGQPLTLCSLALPLKGIANVVADGVPVSFHNTETGVKWDEPIRFSKMTLYL